MAEHNNEAMQDVLEQLAELQSRVAVLEDKTMTPEEKAARAEGYRKQLADLHELHEVASVARTSGVPPKPGYADFIKGARESADEAEKRTHGGRVIG